MDTFRKAATLLTLLMPAAAAADQLFTDDLITTGNICAGGYECVDGEPFGATDIKIKGTIPELQFFDTSEGDSTWTISVDDTTSGVINGFTIRNENNYTFPFKINEDAPTSALFIDNTGNIGLGTAVPQQNLHIADSFQPAIRLADTGGTPYSRDLRGNEEALAFVDAETGDTPFKIEAGAPHQALVLDTSGNIGVGTSAPTAMLHVTGALGSTQIKVDETSLTSGPRTLLNLQNNGRPEIVLGNTDTGGEWSFGAGTNFILKQGAVGSTSSAKTKLFEVTATGDATLTGSLVTGGTACGGGCDRVFTEHAVIPAADYAREMWTRASCPMSARRPKARR
ncbi:MAG: hypothetical protein R3D85_13335 [Paracoccaceae bacterium]